MIVRVTYELIGEVDDVSTRLAHQLPQQIILLEEDETGAGVEAGRLLLRQISGPLPDDRPAA